MSAPRSSQGPLFFLLLVGVTLVWSTTLSRPTEMGGELSPVLNTEGLSSVSPTATPAEDAGTASAQGVRVDLSPDPVRTKDATPGPEEPRVRLHLLRWPDRAPIEDVALAYFGDPRPKWTQGRTGAGGRIEFPDAPLTGTIELSLLVDGFEPRKIDLEQPRQEGRYRSVLLVPTEGHYGRVVDPFGNPLADERVAGFWIESPRPVRGLFSPTGNEQEEPGYAFFGGKGDLDATQPTDDEGYYYIEPLGAEVLGHLSLFVRHAEASSETLHLELPHDPVRLPDLVLHPPMEIFGTVEDSNGQLLPETLLRFSLPGDPSKELAPMRTDEAGSFRRIVPSEGVEVSVERMGYRLEHGGAWRSFSADGTWQAWQDLAANAEQGNDWFLSACGSWKHPLPRERHQVRVQPSEVGARLVLTELPPLVFRVIDEEQRPVMGARLHMTYGGHVTQTADATTDGKGLCSFLDADRAWQPMLLEVHADGFLDQTHALPVQGPGQMTIRLRVPEEEEGSEAEEPVLARIELFGPNGPAAGALVQVYSSKGGAPKHTGRADDQGRFEFEASEPKSHPLYYFAALQGEGSERIGGTSGPVGTVAVYEGEVINMNLTAARPVAVRLGGLEAPERYRASLDMAPFREAEKMPLLEFRVPPGTSPFFVRTVYVPENWSLSGEVFCQTRGNVPALDFMRADPRHPDFRSMRTTWSEWGKVAQAGPVFTLGSRTTLQLLVEGRVSVGGYLLGRPYGDARSLFLVARNGLGDWISPVQWTGSFEFLDIPIGSYSLLLYARPEREGDDASSMITTFKGTFEYSQFDLILEWPVPEEEEDSQGGTKPLPVDEEAR